MSASKQAPGQLRRRRVILATMLIREASPADWPAIWPFMREIVRAGETAETGPNHGGPASHIAGASFMVDPVHAAVSLWRSLGFEVLATISEGFCHPVHGYVGLHIMFQRL